MPAPRIRLKSHEDGNVTFRATVHDTIWKMCCKWAETVGVTPMQAFWILQIRIVSLIEGGDYEFLGPEFGRAIKMLVVNDKIGVGGAPPIDVSKLHRSTRTKSGFTGVYANGNGFRAVDPTGHAIKTAPTAEAAAWIRYLYYKREGLPYGDAEEALVAERHALKEEVSMNRKLAGDVSDEALLELINDVRRASSRPMISIEEMQSVDVRSSSKDGPKAFGFKELPDELK